MTAADKRKAARGPRVPAPDGTLDIAISLAKVGWPVFPVSIYEGVDGGPRHKVPAVKWKDEATTDPDLVREWWGGEHAGRWIGIYAEKAGILIADLDPAKLDKATGKMRLSGHESIAEAGLELTPTFSYPTHRKGGEHHVYRAPEGVAVTIGADIIGPDGEKLHGVDVRAGSGLVVYYGPKLKKLPRLAEAPEWLILERERDTFRGGVDAAPGATEEEFRRRLLDDKPKKKLARLVRGVEFPAGAAHEPMLEVVAALIGEGKRGTPGVKALLDETRERYVKGGADRARDWDNAVEGSIRRFGLPLRIIPLTDAQRAEVKRRNSPKEIERREAERKATFRATVHASALSTATAEERPAPGSRVLEDSALAPEFAGILRETWAYADGYGIMRYKNGRWAPAEEHTLFEAVRKELVSIEIDEHTAAAMRGDNKAIDKARTLLSRSRAVAVGRLIIGILAEDEPAFDAHPDLLNTPTGVVDLRTGELRPHDPALYMTKMTDAPYDPDADSEMWDIARTALPDEVAAYMQLRLGQALTGYTPDDDVLTILEGAGENGKTAWLIGVRKAMGDYAAKLPDRLMVGDPGDHPTTLMTLMGARAGIIEELPEGRTLNVKRLKDVVGTPEITARKMRQDDVTFRNQSCIFLATNYLPIVAETDHGTWRRLALIRFRQTFLKRRAYRKRKKAGTLTGHHRIGDPRVKRYFEHAADPGLLAWLVKGARLWYEAGMMMPDPPKIVEKDTEAWRLDADPILAYVRERLERDEGYGVTTNDLASDFNLWLEKRGHKAWSAQTIASRFQGHVSMDGVERRTVKWTAKLRPSRSRSSLLSAPIPATTAAWKGVRFADEPSRVVSEAERDAAILAGLEKGLKR